MINKEILYEEIQKYLNLKIYDKLVPTPYYINYSRKKDLRVMVGKGTAEEIEMEFKIWAKVKNFDAKSSTVKEIRLFMSEIGLGIDCSGFVVHVLNNYLLRTKKQRIWKYFKLPKSYSWYLKIGYLLRSAEKLGVNIITNKDNSTNVHLKEVKILDLIKSTGKKLNSDHIMLITNIIKNSKNDLPELIEYYHSSPYYGEENGVKKGLIKIKDINKPLEEQEWLEKDENGLCHTLEGYLMDKTNNGIRRLKFLDEICG